MISGENVQGRAVLAWAIETWDANAALNDAYLVDTGKAGREPSIPRWRDLTESQQLAFCRSAAGHISNALLQIQTQIVQEHP